MKNLISNIENPEDEFFIKTAFDLSKKSKCVSKKVGAVLVKDGRIISMGYNGSPPHHINCCDHFDAEFDLDEHHRWSLTHEIHGEMNCLMFAAKNGISTLGCSLYTTLSPCQDCLKNSIQAGIVRFVFLNQYRRNTIPDDLFEYMKNNNITIERLVPRNIFPSVRDTLLEFAKDSSPFIHTIKEALYYYTFYIPDKDIVVNSEFFQRYVNLLFKYTGEDKLEIHQDNINNFFRNAIQSGHTLNTQELIKKI